jgi:hypothetical protein
MKLILWSVLIVVMSVITCATPALADILTLPGQSLSTLNADLSVTKPPTASVSESLSTNTIKFDKFDPILGTLTKVDIAFASWATWSMGIDATVSPFSDGFGGDAQFNVTLGVNVEGLGQIFSFTNGASGYQVDCTGLGESCSDNNHGYIPFHGLYNTNDPSDLNNFLMSGSSNSFGIQGLGDFSLSITACSTAEGVINCSAYGDLGWGKENVIGLGYIDQFVVTYTYEPKGTGVPEPATMLLLGVGLISLIGIGRIKK